MNFYADGDGQLRSSTPLRARSQRSLNEPNGAAGGGTRPCNGNVAHRTSPRDQSYNHYYTTNNNLTTGSRRSNGHVNRSPNQHQNTYTTHSHVENDTFVADTSTYSPAELRKKVTELQRELSDRNLEHVMLQSELNEARAENDRLNSIIREKDLAHEKLRKQSETVIQTTCALYESLRQFKVRYYQEKNGNFFSDPPAGEDRF